MQQSIDSCFTVNANKANEQNCFFPVIEQRCITQIMVIDHFLYCI